MPARHPVDADRLDPSDAILQREVLPESCCHILGDPGVGTGRAEIEEQAAVTFHDAGDLGRDLAHPVEIGLARTIVVIAAVGQADIIRRAGHHGVDTGIPQVGSPQGNRRR